MIPHERSLVEKMKDKPFALLGVNSDPDKSFYASENKDDMKVIWRSFWCGPKGTGGPLPAKWNVNSWPTIYVLDHKGVIRFKNVRGEKMEAAVEELLAEMGKEAPKDKKG
jgi:hypothetical protein